MNNTRIDSGTGSVGSTSTTSVATICIVGLSMFVAECCPVQHATRKLINELDVHYWQSALAPKVLPLSFAQSILSGTEQCGMSLAPQLCTINLEW